MTAEVADRETVERPSRRSSTPTILQMEATECGAASLAMILGHYGCWIPLEQLRLACGISRDGSKASNIVKAARNYGLEAHGYRVDMSAALAKPMPCIVYWHNNHFLVLEGSRRGHVYLNDPAYGPRKLSVAEFEEGYSGIVLVFAPTEQFRRQGAPPRLLTGLVSRLTGPARNALLLAFLVGLLLVVPGLLLPLFLKIFVDSILVNGQVDWMLPLAVGLALAALLHGGLTWLQQSLLAWMQTLIGVTGASRFFWHTLTLPIGFYTQRYTGDIVSRFQSTTRISQLLSASMTSSVIDSAMAVFYGVVMLFLSLPLALATFAMVGINALALRLIQVRRENLNRRLAQQSGKVSGAGIAGIQAVETIKATGTEDEFFRIWSGYHANMFNAEQHLGALATSMSELPKLLTLWIAALVLCGGGLLIVRGDFTIGGLVAFQFLLGNFTRPINNLVSFAGELQEIKADTARVDDTLSHPKDPLFQASSGTSEATGKLSGHLVLNNISFSYSPLDKPLLEDFSLEVPPGARVALVGGSGSGKSTIARMIVGFYRPHSGAVLIDGIPIAEIDRDQFTASLAYVGQEIYLFEDSVRNNIAMWDADLPLEDVSRAAIDACIHDEIASRPGGYESVVAEGGDNFSGGQKQRIEIARALARNPTLLVLDEATAALDPLTEQLIDSNLRRRGCSCVIIAHRLSTIRDADEIVVLDRGKVVERGNHTQLLERQGRYAELLAKT